MATLRTASAIRDDLEIRWRATVNHSGSGPTPMTHATPPRLHRLLPRHCSPRSRCRSPRGPGNRTDAIAEAQAEKASHLTPPIRAGSSRSWSVSPAVPPGAQRFLPLPRQRLFRRGFTLGGATAHYVGDRAMWFAQGLYSIKDYKLVESGINAPGLAGGAWLPAECRLAGRDTGRLLRLAWTRLYDDRCELPLNEPLRAEVTFHPVPWSVFTGAVPYDAYDTKEEQGDYRRSRRIHAGHRSRLGPTDHVRLARTAGIDLRPHPASTTVVGRLCEAGGYYWRPSTKLERRRRLYSFDQMDVDLVSTSILKETWVLSAPRPPGSRSSTTDDTVPRTS